MNEDIIKQAFDKLYGELNLTPQDAAYKIFRMGWITSREYCQQKLDTPNQ